MKAGAFAAFLLLFATACAATVPKAQYDADLAGQREDYEKRLLRADEDQKRVEKERDEAAVEVKKSEASFEGRIEQLETALADKQRTLDDVTTQLVELQDAFGKISSKERSKLEGETEREKAVKAALTTLRARFAEALKEEAEKASVEQKDNSVLVRIKDGVLFARGSSRPQPAAKATIDRLAKAIKASETSALRIDVHCDAVKSQDSWALTDQQGAALVKALQKLGVDPSRLSYTSFGQYRPIASNDSEEGRTENRRVEIWVDVPLVLPKK